MTLPATFDGPHLQAHHWRASGPACLARIDLSGLVEQGLVTAVQVEPDGALTIHCPGGLPADLAGLVEPVAEVVEDDRLARLERGLERLGQELQARETATDRMDAVEFGLAEKLHAVISEEVFNLFAEQEEARPSVSDRLDQILQAVQDQRAAPMAEIAARIEALFARPLPAPDLQPMRQMNALTLQALNQITARLEASAATFAAEGPLAARLRALEERMPDLSDLVGWLANLPAPDTTPMVEALAHGFETLAARLAALEARPAPDLSRDFALLDHGLQRIEQALDRPADPALARIASTMEAMEARLTALESRPVPDVAAWAEAQAAQPRAEPLTDAILALAQRANDRSVAAQPDMQAFRAAQAEFFGDLRFLLADIVATQMRPPVKAA